MITREKEEVLRAFCNEHRVCSDCPAFNLVPKAHPCLAIPYVDSNFDIIVNAGIINPNNEIDRKNDEIEFIKVEHEEAEAEERGAVTEKKIISTALHSYGADKQRAKCIEELSELQKEICKDLIGGGSQFHISEEIADVEIVIAQMKIHYGCARDVAAIKAQKLKQLAKNLGMECGK